MEGLWENTELHPNRSTSSSGPCLEIGCWWALHCFLSTPRSAVSKSLYFLTFYSFQRLPGSPKLPRTFCTSFKNHVHIFHLFLDIVVCMSCYLQVFIYFFAGRAGAEVQSWQTTPAGKSYLPLVVGFTGELSHFLMTGEKKVKRIMHFRICENYVKFKFQCWYTLPGVWPHTVIYVLSVTASRLPRWTWVVVTEISELTAPGIFAIWRFIGEKTSPPLVWISVLPLKTHSCMVQTEVHFTIHFVEASVLQHRCLFLSTPIGTLPHSLQCCICAKSTSVLSDSWWPCGL